MGDPTVIFWLICVASFLSVVTLFFVVASIRLAPEEKRLKIHRLGRDIGLRGPGLVVLIPFIDRGVMVEAGKQIPTPEPPAEGGQGPDG